MDRRRAAVVLVVRRLVLDGELRIGVSLGAVDHLTEVVFHDDDPLGADLNGELLDQALDILTQLV